MKSIYHYNKVTMGTVLMLVLLLLTACAEDSEDMAREMPLQMVNAQLTISLPKRIANKKKHNPHVVRHRSGQQ